jgi:hypothetical protein
MAGDGARRQDEVRPNLGSLGMIGDEISIRTWLATRRIDLSHQGRYAGEDDSAATATPASALGRNNARGRKQMAHTVSSPPCGSLGVLLVGEEAAEREIDGGGRALGFAGRRRAWG